MRSLSLILFFSLFLAVPQSATAAFHRGLCKRLLNSFFIPQKGNDDHPDLKYEALEILSKDNTILSGIRVRTTAKSPKALLLQFHGSRGNVFNQYKFMSWAPPSGIDVIAFDYRGYGKSSGIIGIDGIHEDVRAMLNYASAVSAKEDLPIILYGQSIGSTMLLKALEEVSPQNVLLIVLESPFSSYGSAAKDIMSKNPLLKLFNWIPSIVLSREYDPSYLGLSLPRTPVVVIHSKNDTFMPADHSKKIYKKLSEPKQLWLFETSSHVGAMLVEQGSLAKNLNRLIDSLLSLKK